MKRFYRLPEKKHHIVTSWYKSCLFYIETLLFVNWKICSGSVNTPWRNQKQDLSFRSFAYLMSLAAYIIAGRCFIVLPSWFYTFLLFGSRENIPPNSDFVFFNGFIARVWLFTEALWRGTLSDEHLIVYIRYIVTLANFSHYIFKREICNFMRRY